MKKRMYLKICGITALACMTGLALADPAKAMDFKESYGLSIVLGSEEQIQDINENGNGYQVDLYRIADLESDPKYVSYTYIVDTEKYDFKGYDLSTYEGLKAMDNESYMEIAQIAAQAIHDGSIDPDYSHTEKDSLNFTVEKGLYLAITHGPETDYWNEEDGELSTIVNSRQSVYSYSPQLLSIPSTADIIDGTEVITSSGGDWQDTLTAVLKPSQGVRYGDLVINKDFERYEGSTTVTCVIKVNATMPDAITGELRNVYSNVFAIDGSSAKDPDQVEIIGKIPVGADVTVEEIYDGAGYALETEKTPRKQTVTILPPTEEPVSVSFLNDYADGVKKGFGIENRFTETDGKLTWETNVPVSANNGE